MKIVVSAFLGVAFGACSALLHNAFVPSGLIISLIGSGVGIWLIGRGWGRRLYKSIAACGWFLIVLRAGVFGVGNELLIEGNTMGDSLILAGVVMLIISVAAKV